MTGKSQLQKKQHNSFTLNVIKSWRKAQRHTAGKVSLQTVSFTANVYHDLCLSLFSRLLSTVMSKHSSNFLVTSLIFAISSKNHSLIHTFEKLQLHKHLKPKLLKIIWFFPTLVTKVLTSLCQQAALLGYNQKPIVSALPEYNQKTNAVKQQWECEV